MGSPSPLLLNLPAANQLAPPRFVYERRQPELSALHRAVRAGWPQVKALARERTGVSLPEFVDKAMKAYLACGQLANGFARFRCADCRKDVLVAFSCKVRGLCPSCDGKRMLEEAEHMTTAILPEIPYRQWVFTLPFDLRYVLAWNADLRNAVHQALMRAIAKHYERDARSQGLEGPVQGAAISVAQRFSSDLKLNLHWHVLLADGVWTEQDGHATFHPAAPLDTLRVQETLHDAVLRIDKVLKRKGWQGRTDDPFAESEPALAELWRAALLGRPIDDSVALQNKAQLRGLPRPHGRNCAEMHGFSLHANTFVGPAARDELYKLVKYLCRPSIAGKRVTEQEDGRFRVELKTAWRDGTTAVFLSPANLTARMAALIPLPGRPAIRYYGAFAPNAKLRPLVVQAGAQAPRRRDKPQAPGHDCQVALTDTELAHHAVEQARRDSGRLAWSVAMRLAWKIDVLQCDCGGHRRLVAVIDQPTVVRRILAHLGLATEVLTQPEDPIWRVRGPPQALFPPDLDDAGLPVELDTVDEDPDEPFFDELPDQDWAA